jgi:GxxExxY protein
MTTSNSQNLKLDQITYIINRSAMKIHKTLGNTFQEVIYQRCMEIELQKSGLSFEAEVEKQIYYEGVELGIQRADFIVADQVVMELKAVITLEDVHLAQAKNYVAAYNFPVGLLINFGSLNLEYKKFFNPRY